MISFIFSVVILIVGYFVYGKIVEKFFGITNNQTPAYTKLDYVDYVPMSNRRALLVQFLNIAGTGPIFGALMGACFGPVVYLWIVLGSIFAGGVHDYMTGMMSVRMGGATVPEIVGKYLGNGIKYLMRAFCVLLLILVGSVFTSSSSMLLALLTPNILDMRFWVIVILIYFFLATFLPVDKIIGRLYPIFGAALLLMALGILIALFVSGEYSIPEISFANMYPNGEQSIFPYMFITVACGAISGFHATQSPIISRCLKKESAGRKVFYLAMIIEGMVALVWAAAGVAFYESTGGLLHAIQSYGQSTVVYTISKTLMGPIGGVLAIVGVVACPITSGDTAFRSARLTIAEWFHLEQKSIPRRLLISIPLILAGGCLTLIDFDIIWRYFSYANQTLAMIVLWAGAVYLVEKSKYRYAYLICLIPACFMTAVTCCYIMVAKEGFRMSLGLGKVVAVTVMVVFCILFFVKIFKNTSIKK